MKIKDAALKEILAEVEGEIASLLKTEKQRLAKASEESPGESSPGGEASAGGESSPQSGGAGGPPDASASAGAPPAASPSAPPAGPDAGAMGAMGGAPADPAAAGAAGAPGMDAPPSLEELVAEYSKLPPEELKMHYLASKTALFQVMGAADGGAGAGAPGSPSSPSASPAGAPAGAPPAPAGASPSAPPMGGDVPPAPPAMKGEMPWGSKTEGNDEHASDSDPTPSGTGQTKPVVNSVTKGAMPYGSKTVGNDAHASDSNPKPSGTGQTKPVVNSVTKSESAELEELRKGQEQMAKILETLLTVPERKAWTGTEIQYIKKSEAPVRNETKPLKKSVDEFSVADVNAKLNEVTRNPSLKKSDRERINQFYANQIGLEEIKDLLLAQ